MRRGLALALALFAVAIVGAQDYPIVFSLDASWGSLRTPYPYLQSLLSFRAEGFAAFGTAWGAQASIRAYGSPWFASAASMDVQARAFPAFRVGPLSLSPYLGFEFAWRAGVDERDPSAPHFAPCLGVELAAGFGWFEPRLRAEGFAFLDGASLRSTLELRARFGVFSAFVAAACDWTFSMSRMLAEFRWDSFAGVGFSL